LHASGDKIEILRVANPKLVANLVLDIKDAQVIEDFTGYFLELRAHFNRPDWSLLWNGKIVSLNGKVDLVLSIPIKSDRTEAKIYAVGPSGEIEIEKIVVLLPVRYLKKFTENKAWSLAVGLSYTILSYEEIGAGNDVDQNQSSLTAKVSAIHRTDIKSAFSYGGSLYISLLALSSSETPSARFIGVNGRLGYDVPGIKQPWRVSALVGFYYTTMLVPLRVDGSSYGFRNLMGPQIYPVVTRTLRNNQTLSGYFKFSPVGQGIGWKNLGNREIAFGLSWKFSLKKKLWSVALDIANLHLGLNLTDTLTGEIYPVSINSNSVSLGFSYHW